MKLRSVKADATYLVRTWYRSRASVAMSLVLPIILLLAFGVIFGPTEPSVPRVGVEDLDGSDAAAELAAALALRASIDAGPVAPPPGEDAAAWLRAQDLDALLRIPAGFGNGTASPVLILNEAAPAQADAVQSAVESALAEHRGDAPELDVARVRLREDIPYSSFLLPGVIGLNVVVVGLFTSASSVAQLRHRGLLGRLAVSPMTKSEWVLSRMLAQSVICVLASLCILLVGWLVFHPTLTPSPWSLVILVSGTCVFAGLGTILGGLVKQEQTSVTVINLVYFPLVLLSGSFFGTERLPAFLQGLSWLSPLTYLNGGLRADMVLGERGAAMTDALVLVGLAVVVVAVGARVVDWTEGE